ncbi:MAG: M36 family metallopeptidase [Acidobacteria bacterium]|nr:M36 family metallopeptidase [Acidobacteriota bacterium]
MRRVALAAVMLVATLPASAQIASRHRLRVRVDQRAAEVVGAPAFIQSHAGFLTGTSDARAWRATLRAYVAAHESLFGVDPDVLDTCRVSREIFATDTGARFLTLQQTVNGLDLLGAELRAGVTAVGEIVTIASTLVPATPAPRGGQAYLPLDRGTIRPVTVTRVHGSAPDDVVEEIRDAIDGRLLVSRDVVLHASATYDVFARSDLAPADSPTPASPGFCAPGATQPAVIARSLRSLAALDGTASPNGWIDPNDSVTSGNNVAAHLPAAAPIAGPSFRVFDFPIDLGLAPSASSSASVTQLFYDVNWIHDRLYHLGFDEASGNYQRLNFGRGGLPGDAIDAVAQDTGSNNAFFVPAPDGTSGSLHLFNFTFPTPDRDGALDAEVVIHEAAHGLSTRLVGDLSAVQSDGLGEGWSDFYSLALLAEPSDDPRGCYAEAAYVAYQLVGLTSNYTFGIRRYPYSADLAVNPLTFADIDPAQIAFPPSIPRSPLIGSIIAPEADESHNVGEVWASALWSARGRLVGALGFAGNERMLRLVTDGMKLTPANPTFTQARDAILAADRIDFGGADLALLWAGFAERGLGFSAVAPPPTTTHGAFEAFDAPPGLAIPGPASVPVLPDSGLLILALGIAGGGFLALRQSAHE